MEAELEALRAEHEVEAEQQKEHAAEMEKERQAQANAAMNAEAMGMQVGMDGKRKLKGKKAKEAMRATETVLEMSIEEYEAERRRVAEEDEW